MNELVDGALLSQLYKFWLSEGVPESRLIDLLDIQVSKSGMNLPERINLSKFDSLHQIVFQYSESRLYSFRSGYYLAQSNLSVIQLIYAAPSLSVGLAEGLRFVAMSMASTQFAIEEVEGNIVIKLAENEFTDLSYHYTGMLFAMIGAILERCSAQSIDAVTGIIPEDDPSKLESIQQFCQFTVVSGSEFEFTVPLGVLREENPTANLHVFRSLVIDLSKQQEKFKKSCLQYAELREVIQRYISCESISQQSIAEHLGIGVRKLQRILKSLGTSYQELLDDCRRELAMKLVKDLTMPLHEVSFAIGYREPSAFYKAFKRWLNMTPGEYRELLVKDNKLD